MKVGILGAGSIGAYIGACLTRAGIATTLVGREALSQQIRAHGLHITDHRGEDFELRADEVRYSTGAAALAGCDMILVTVKCAATRDAARELRPHLAAGTTVVSLQNGVRNAATLRELLPGAQVLAGMVPFNVRWRPPAHFHRGTSGTLLIEDLGRGRDVAALLTGAGVRADVHENLPAVLWGKLLLNLNNAISALAGIPLRAQLSLRGYRRALAACMREALPLIAAAGIRPERATALPPALMPAVLCLPDWLFRRVARRMLEIDAEAISSMLDDLERGRETEIDYINGEVLALAARLGREAPVNARVVEMIREAERAGKGSPRLSAETILARLAP
jgi:2-dehydropantoate 2-reductase